MANHREEKGLSLIIKTTTRLVVGYILLFGIYLVLHGHLSPGGGFSGGLIIALSLVLLILAFGSKDILKKLTDTRIASLEGLGALLFLLIAASGLAGGYFFFNFIGKGKPFNLFSAGLIPLSNIAIAAKVAIGLFSIFVVLIVLNKSKNE